MVLGESTAMMNAPSLSIMCKNCCNDEVPLPRGSTMNFLTWLFEPEETECMFMSLAGLLGSPAGKSLYCYGPNQGIILGSGPRTQGSGYRKVNLLDSKPDF